MRYKDAESIMQDDKYCYLSGRRYGLEKHHIFGGANRKHSAQYGLWVWLHHDLHNEPPLGVHHCAERNRMLQRLGQQAFELYYPELDFLKIFGRNYL